jgi:hypothetical protein
MRPDPGLLRRRDTAGLTVLDLFEGGHPDGDVEHQAKAPQQRRHHEGRPHVTGRHAQAVGYAAGHPRQDAVGRASMQVKVESPIGE